MAYHLARRGAQVCVLERLSAPAAGVTGKSFGWVGMSAALPSDNHDLFRLRSQAVRDYARLEGEFGCELPKSSTGAIVWRRTADATQALVEEQRAESANVDLIARGRIAELEPQLISPPECAAYAPDDFAVEPAKITGLLMRAAQDAGATVVFGEEATHIETKNGKVSAVHTHSRNVPTDIVVLANGTEAATLASSFHVELRLERSPAVLLRFSAERALVHQMLTGPELEIRQAPKGSLYVAEWYPGDGEQGLDALAQRTVTTIRELFRIDETPRLQSVSAAFRPVPSDGWPLRGFVSEVEGIYVAVAHPGIMLAPFLGRTTAEDIIDGRQAAPMRQVHTS